MAPSIVTLELVMHELPAEALQRVKDAVSRGGGAITNATRFSNKALSLQLELDAHHLVSLRDALSAAGNLSQAGAERLAELAQMLAPDCEVQAFVHVTLVHTAPDERIELPKVPG